MLPTTSSAQVLHSIVVITPCKTLQQFRQWQ
jgi:hypothetical protein